MLFKKWRKFEEICLFFTVFGCFAGVFGCGGGYVQENSSMEEALFVVEHNTEAYARTLFYSRVSVKYINSQGVVTNCFPVAFHPTFADSIETPFSHIVLLNVIMLLFG
jgi:hypothetical protein